MTDMTRNEILLAELEDQRSEPVRPGLDALAKAINGVTTDEEMDAIRTVAWTRRTAYECDGCDHVFVDGDVVHRRRKWHDAAPFGWGWGYISACEGCVSTWHPSWLEHRREPVACAGGCGALVSHWGYERITTCSSRCAELARKAKRRVAHEERACAECGVPFAPTRSDARYCSSPCRQRAYRHR